MVPLSLSRATRLIDSRKKAGGPQNASENSQRRGSEIEDTLLSGETLADRLPHFRDLSEILHSFSHHVEVSDFLTNSLNLRIMTSCPTLFFQPFTPRSRYQSYELLDLDLRAAVPQVAQQNPGSVTLQGPSFACHRSHLSSPVQE